MKSISSLSFIATAIFFGASHATAVPSRNVERQYSTLTYKGCYSSSTGLTFNASYQYQTKGYCQTLCVQAGNSVEATTQKTGCWCGDDVPPSTSLVSDSFCNDGCAGYGSEMCGSADGKYFSVYLTGLADSSVSSGSESESESSPTSTAAKTVPTSTTSAKPSVVTLGGQTVVVTASSTPTAASATSSASAKSSGGPSKAGIAAGVVVGIVAISAIAGGIFLFVRSKRRREVEEEYKRNAAVSSFIAGKPPPSSGGASSINDTRLDPVMAQRRMSDGSIADNQDYTRRILKVTNA